MVGENRSDGFPSGRFDMHCVINAIGESIDDWPGAGIPGGIHRHDGCEDVAELMLRAINHDSVAVDDLEESILTLVRQAVKLVENDHMIATQEWARVVDHLVCLVIESHEAGYVSASDIGVQSQNLTLEPGYLLHCFGSMCFADTRFAREAKFDVRQNSSHDRCHHFVLSEDVLAEGTPEQSSEIVKIPEHVHETFDLQSADERVDRFSGCGLHLFFSLL